VRRVFAGHVLSVVVDIAFEDSDREAGSCVTDEGVVGIQQSWERGRA